MIEVIYAQKDGSFADKDKRIENTYYGGEHFNLFIFQRNNHGREKSHPSHWRINTVHPDKKYTGQSIIVIDLDKLNKDEQVVKYNTEVLKPIIEIMKLKRQNCGINFTGYGYHLYVFFDKDFKPENETWLKDFIKPINDKIKPMGFHIDGASFQAKQCIRFPGSPYLKKSGGKTVGPHSTYIILYPENKLSWSEFKAQFVEKKKTIASKKKQKTKP